MAARTSLPAIDPARETPRRLRTRSLINLLLGLRHALDAPRDGVPAVIEQGHDYLQRFTACQGTALCREIRGDSRVPLRCVSVMQQAAVLCALPVSAREQHCTWAKSVVFRLLLD